MFGFPEIVTLFIESIVSRRGRAYKKVIIKKFHPLGVLSSTY